MNIIKNIRNNINSSTKSIKKGAKTMGTTALLALALTSCNPDNSKIHLDYENKSASFSILYEGHKSGNQDFSARITIMPGKDGQYILKIKESGLGNDKKMEGTDPAKLLNDAKSYFVRRIPINTKEGSQRMEERVKQKFDFVSEKYDEILKSDNSRIKEAEITYQAPKK